MLDPCWDKSPVGPQCCPAALLYSVLVFVGQDPAGKSRQDPKQNEQKQEKNEEKKDGKVCCKAPNMPYILKGKCKDQYKKVDRGKCD